MAQVDIIMPLYNKASCVARAIESIQQQTAQDWRLIVVDDGSTDQSPDVVREIKDPRIQLLQQPNRGPGAARNAGIAQAASQYLAFLDADDEWLPPYLANALNAIQNNDVALVATMYYQWPQKRDMTHHFARHKVIPGKYSLKGSESPAWVSCLLGFMSPWNSVTYTDVVRKYDGFYDKQRCARGEDTTFFFRVGFGEDFMIIGPPAVRFHSEDSALGSVGEPYALQPYLAEPDSVLRYCPTEKRDLLLKVLDFRALRTARDWARHGQTAEAAELLARFPGAKAYRIKYCRYLYESAISNWSFREKRK